MGRTVVLEVGQVQILMAERSAMTVDPALFQSHGIDPVYCRIVVVKSPNGFRAAYEPIAKAIYMVDTPGVSTANLKSPAVPAGAAPHLSARSGHTVPRGLVSMRAGARVVLLALVLNMVCYTDRACIAVAGPEISKEFHFSQGQMGLIYGVFSLSYFLGQAPWGMLADRVGSRWIVSFCRGGMVCLHGPHGGGVELRLPGDHTICFRRIGIGFLAGGRGGLLPLDSGYGTRRRIRSLSRGRQIGSGHHTPHRCPAHAALRMAHAVSHLRRRRNCGIRRLV